MLHLKLDKWYVGEWWNQQDNKHQENQFSSALSSGNTLASRVLLPGEVVVQALLRA